MNYDIKFDSLPGAKLYFFEGSLKYYLMPEMQRIKDKLATENPSISGKELNKMAHEKVFETALFVVNSNEQIKDFRVTHTRTMALAHNDIVIFYDLEYSMTHHVLYNTNSVKIEKVQWVYEGDSPGKIIVDICTIIGYGAVCSTNVFISEKIPHVIAGIRSDLLYSAGEEYSGSQYEFAKNCQIEVPIGEQHKNSTLILSVNDLEGDDYVCGLKRGCIAYPYGEDGKSDSLIIYEDGTRSKIPKYTGIYLDKVKREGDKLYIDGHIGGVLLYNNDKLKVEVHGGGPEIVRDDITITDQNKFSAVIDTPGRANNMIEFKVSVGGPKTYSQFDPNHSEKMDYRSFDVCMQWLNPGANFIFDGTKPVPVSNVGETHNGLN